MSAWRWIESVLLQLPMRLALGGVFVYAAFNKILDIQSFAFAIKGFKILDPAAHGNLIISAAYTIPWVEMIAGVLLILGLRSRAAALTLTLTLLVFIAGLVHVITSGIQADCSCFGDQNLFCKPGVSWCQVIRNLVLLVPAIYLLVRGGGILALDQAFRKPDRNPIDTTYRQQGVDETGIRA